MVTRNVFFEQSVADGFLTSYRCGCNTAWLLFWLLLALAFFMQGLELNESDFETMCGTAMQNFLKEYTSTLKGFDRDHLAKVARKHPEFFEKRTSEENEEMFVEWQLDKSRVRVAGVKKEVDLKVKEIARFVETAVPKYVG